MGHSLPYSPLRSSMKTLLFLAIVAFACADPEPAAEPVADPKADPALLYSGYYPALSYGLGTYGGYYGAYAPYVIGRKRRSAEPAADPKADPALLYSGYGG